MAGHIYPQGRTDFLKNQLGVSTPEPLLVHLFFNRKTPIDGDTVSSFVELNFQGYSPQVLTPSSWTVTAPSGGNLAAVATYPTVTWTCTLGGSIPTVAWGYFLTGQTSGHLIAAELLLIPIEFGQSDTVNVNVVLNFNSQA